MSITTFDPSSWPLGKLLRLEAAASAIVTHRTDFDFSEAEFADISSRLRVISAEVLMRTDPTTWWAERIREETGMAWETACMVAESERDRLERGWTHAQDRSIRTLGRRDVLSVERNQFGDLHAQVLGDSRAWVIAPDGRAVSAATRIHRDAVTWRPGFDTADELAGS